MHMTLSVAEIGNSSLGAKKVFVVLQQGMFTFSVMLLNFYII